MENLKVIIPCAGRRTRMYPLSKNCPKILLPYQNKTVLDYIIESLLVLDFAVKFVFVINPRLGYMVREYVANNYPSLDVQFSIQTEPLGFGHAVLQAQEHISDEPVLVHASDKVLDFTDFDTESSWMAVHELEDPPMSGVLDIKDGNVRWIIEKPRMAWSAVCYVRETDLLFESLQMHVDMDLRTAGEYQMTDALIGLISAGVNIQAKSIKCIYG